LLTIAVVRRVFHHPVVYTLGLLIALWLCYLDTFPFLSTPGLQLADYSKLALTFLRLRSRGSNSA